MNHLLSSTRPTKSRLTLGLILLGLLILIGCKPFEISAKVEPNDLADPNSGLFDVAVSIEPEAVAAIAQPEAQPAKNNEEVVQPIAAQQERAVAATIATPTATPIPTPTPTIVPPNYPAIVLNVDMNVRLGPSIASDRIGGLRAGTTAAVVGTDALKQWWQIIYPANSSGRGWVAAEPTFSRAYQIANVPVRHNLPSPANYQPGRTSPSNTVASTHTAPPTPRPTPSPPPQIRLVVHSDLAGTNSLIVMNQWARQRRYVVCGYGNDNVSAAVSRDGQKVAFVSDRDGNQEIYTVNIDGSNLTRLTYDASADKWPAWSPNGQRIAFDSERDGNREIYTMNADGSGVVRVTNHWAEDGAPAWSPDGTQLVFHSNRDGNHDIYTMNAGGGGINRLTFHAGNEWSPAWSPNGRQIVFTGYHDSQTADIYVMDVDGGNLRNLTNDPAEDAVPVWSPDGKRIAFESRRSGNLDVFIMDADGANLRQVTYTKSNDGRPAWVAPKRQ